MDFFDANVTVGRFRQLTPGTCFGRDALLSDMNRFGIAEALVLDSLSREVHPSSGNARARHLTEGQPRLHPCFSLLPEREGDMGAPDHVLAQMAEAGVRAAKILPAFYCLSLGQWCLGTLLAHLEKQRVPTFIEPNPTFIGGWPPDDTDWDAVVALCRAYPRLPVIVGESRFRSANRMIYQALEACPNLRLELSGLWVHHGIEYICRKFGAERLLFGTKWPVREVGGTIAQVQFADIGDDEKRKIAGDNLRALLQGAFPRRRRTGAVRVTVKPPAGSSLRSRALRGEPPVGEVIIDAHAHLGKTGLYHIADGSPGRVAAEMERLGVLCSIVFGFSGVTGDWTRDNDHIAGAMRKYPGRFHGLILVNPNHPAEMRRELARNEGRGFAGIKLIPHYQGYPEDGPNVRIPVAWANERKLIVLNHGWGPVEHLRRLADDYPEVTFIVGHYTTQYAAIVNTYPNIYQCTCEPLTPRSMEALVSAVDPKKILFGSDVTDLPLPLGMGPILHARIPEDDKKRILGLNALKVLRRLGLAPVVGK